MRSPSQGGGAASRAMRFSPATKGRSGRRWGQVFGDEVLATAILDRLPHHCEVLAINGPSHRLKNRLAVVDTHITAAG
ncbi:ATP-binding protein [Nonomuraea diastatica]|uniref:ATP-binding protein n=1 Tax=Nonomuraea diastatica TaxID=1848329 RepID=UPI001C702973|nr:ATP-binding protein [Nonomuraea diastatica]